MLDRLPDRLNKHVKVIVARLSGAPVAPVAPVALVDYGDYSALDLTSVAFSIPSETLVSTPAEGASFDDRLDGLDRAFAGESDDGSVGPDAKPASAESAVPFGEAPASDPAGPAPAPSEFRASPSPTHLALRVKIGRDEFDAEGEAALVLAEFEAFKRLLTLAAERRLAARKGPATRRTPSPRAKNLPTASEAP